MYCHERKPINWDTVPDVITKDQLYRICHISKSPPCTCSKAGKSPASIRARKHAAIKSRRRMSLPIWKTAKCSPKATPPRRAGTKAIILSRWRSRVPQIVLEHLRAVLYRTALRLSRRADYAGGFQNHRLRKNRDQQLVQSGTHQVFPEKQRQPHSEGLFGGVLLLYLLSHHHPQITVAHPYPARLFQLAENPRPAHSRRVKEVRSNDKFLGRAVLRKC